METSPLVTIAAINYNCARFLIETLQSIQAQTYANYELVIVDDCSTDNSVAVIKEWLSSFNKPFKLIVHPKNLGICATFNDALKNASGKYISFIATDDIMLPDKLKVQVDMLEKAPDDFCAVYSDAYLIKEDGSPRYGWFIQRARDFDNLPDGNIYNALIEGNFLPAMSLLVKLDAIRSVGEFDEHLVYEDYDMWLRLAKKYRFLYSDYVSVKYRVRNGSLVSSIRNWFPSLVMIYAKHLDNPKVISYLEDLARNVYTGRNMEALEVLRKLDLNNPFIKRVLLFHKLNVPIPIGFRILDRTRKRASF